MSGQRNRSFARRRLRRNTKRSTSNQGALRSFLNLSNRASILKAGLILLLVLLAYLPAMRGGFIWDDDTYITSNPTLQTLDGLWKNWTTTNVHYQYYPLVMTTFWVEWHLWGSDPSGYHVVNVLIHGINALLLWVVLRWLGIRGAWLAAAIFALHPVHVESVAWITERKNVLSLFFYLLAGMSYLRFLGLDGGQKTVGNAASQGAAKAGTPEGRYGYYIAALCLFVAALLCKTVTCTLPAAILLIIYWKRGRIQLRDVQLLVPFFITGLGMGLFTAWVEKHRILAEGEDWSLTLLERCLLAGRALWFYAGKLVLPVNLMFFYPRWNISQAVWWQYLYPAAAALFLFGLWALRARLGRGPLVAVLFLAGTLAPALGFFNVYPMRYSFVADHFQYHASIGLIVLAATLLARLASASERHVPRAEILLAVLVLAPLGVRTWQQGHIYKDLETLWRDNIARNPSAWVAHTNLALVLEGEGRLDEALSHVRRALELRPNDPIIKHNVAGMYWRHGMYGEAAGLLKEVLLQRPDLAPAHSLLGTSMLMLKQYDEAEQHLRKAIELDPNYTNSRIGLAELLYIRGRYQESLEICEQLVKNNPENGSFWLMAGQECEALGKLDQAAAAYREALNVQPGLDEARLRLENLNRRLTPLPQSRP